MNFQEYEEKAITTRVYAEEVALPYVVLGLCGEFGEFVEKIQQGAVPELTLKEVGDILWYSAATRVELNLKPLEWPAAIEMNPDGLIEMQKSIGVIAEQMKKYLRDDWKKGGAEFPEERKEKIHSALAVILQELQCMSSKGFNKDLQTIAAENIEKLAKRKQEGKIHGNGDLR